MSATGVLAGDDGLMTAGEHLDELTTFVDDVTITAELVLLTDVAANRCCITTLALVLLACRVVVVVDGETALEVEDPTSACWIKRDRRAAFLSASLPPAVTMPTTSILDHFNMSGLFRIRPTNTIT